MKKYDVLAIGELNVDMILTGLQSLPQLGREIIAKDCSIVLGSSTAICSCGVSQLGLKTGFIGRIGKDRFGDVVIEELTRYGIDTSLITIDEKASTGVTISLSMSKDRAMVTYMGTIDQFGLSDFDLELIKNARHIHVGSFFLQTALRDGLLKLFSTARENGITTSLDAGWDDTGNWNYGIFDVLKYTDIFFPNEGEALHITGKENVMDAVDMLSQYARIAVVKCGPKGAVAKRGKNMLTSPTFDSLKPVDTTGAGDSFNAGFIYAFLNGFDLKECMTYGNACGSISVTRIGGASACATLDEVEALIRRQTPPESSAPLKHS